MRTFFVAALNGLIRNEPCVPAATQIFSLTMRPARDVALVLVRHAKRPPSQLDATGLREMKNIFVAIVEKSRRIDRLEMAERLGIAFHPHPALCVRLSLARERIEVRVARVGFSFDRV